LLLVWCWLLEVLVVGIARVLKVPRLRGDDVANNWGSFRSKGVDTC
jgi:hypothetical protein